LVFHGKEHYHINIYIPKENHSFCKKERKKDQIVVNETNMSIISKGQEYIFGPTQLFFLTLHVLWSKSSCVSRHAQEISKKDIVDYNFFKKEISN